MVKSSLVFQKTNQLKPTVKRAVKRHPEGGSTKKHLRCLRRLVARLRALQEHAIAGTLDTTEASHLLVKINRSPHLPTNIGRQAKILALERQIAFQEQMSVQESIDSWKAKNAGMLKSMFLDGFLGMQLHQHITFALLKSQPLTLFMTHYCAFKLFGLKFGTESRRPSQLHCTPALRSLVITSHSSGQI